MGFIIAIQAARRYYRKRYGRKPFRTTAGGGSIFIEGLKVNWTQTHTWEEWNGYWTRSYVDFSKDEWANSFVSPAIDCRIGPLGKKNTSWKPYDVRLNGVVHSYNVKPQRWG